MFFYTFSYSLFLQKRRRDLNEQQNLFDIIGELQEQESDDWYWYFKDYPSQNGLKVFSCFAGGGGSTMGYKLASFDVIGCVEIDKRMMTTYIENHNPKYSYLMDLREFNAIDNNELPSELFDLDILDGSPPCTTFSMCGNREKVWGVKKKFKEGQVEQTLDDLPFVFIDTVAKLLPKIVIMENVEGLLNGKAWKYVQDIYKKFNKIGYKVKHWLVRGETMGIPQNRHRVIFIATSLNIDLEKLNMSFLYKPITFGQVKSEKGTPIKRNLLNLIISNAKYGDRNLENACKRMRGKTAYFNNCFLYDDKVAPTLTGHNCNIRWCDKCFLSKQDIINISTFPQDYKFPSESLETITYICGMSVPPLMIKRIANRIKEFITSYKIIKE